MKDKGGIDSFNAPFSFGRKREMELKYTDDKGLNNDGRILNSEFLEQIKNVLSSLEDNSLHADVRVIEAILLVFNGDANSLAIKRMIDDIKYFEDIMSMELKYANADKTLSSDGWILDSEFLEQIQDFLSDVGYGLIHTDKEVIEAALLVLQGDTESLQQKQMIKGSEDVMSVEMKYANPDKILNSDGWILDYGLLNQIHNVLFSVDFDTLYVDRQVIEAILLVANGEIEILKRIRNE